MLKKKNFAMIEKIHIPISFAVISHFTNFTNIYSWLYKIYVVLQVYITVL